MIPIKYLIGDATEPVDTTPGPRIIAHVCNDLGGWGAGFVLALSAKWPEPEAAYRKLATRDTEFYNLRLGVTQYVPVNEDLWVVNMVAQHGYRASESNPVPLDYNALAMCLSDLRQRCLTWRASVHMPRIGCGLAGGTWDQVEPVIIEMLSAYDVPCYVYDLA